ncbi:MAG TPA: hypothetical protein VG318_01825 [Actinomycetota bacterium]|nr:hypothetical protein [Actinomycetota bacterium]
MRKLVVVALVTGLLVGSVASAEAGKKKAPKKVTRVAEASYIAPARFYWAPTGDNIGGASFATGAGESFVSVEIADNAGMDVSAAVGQDPEGDGTVTTTPFCTSTEEPVAIQPGLEITVFVFAGPCTDPAPAPAFATQGTITATFSNLP